LRKAVIRRGIAAAAALAALVVGLAWWASSSESGLQFILAQLANRSGGALRFEGVEGYLGQVRIRRVVYKTPELNVVLDAITMDVSRSALARGDLVAGALDAESLTIETTPSAKAPAPPLSLALPVDVTVHRASIKQAHINGEPLRVLTLGYHGGAAGHAVTAFEAQSEYGRIALEGRIDARSPFPLSAKAELVQPERWNALVGVAGDLLHVELDGSADAKGAQAQGRARIAPFAARWLERIEARAQKVDLAKFEAALPTTLLDIDVKGTGAESGWPAGTLVVRNALPGTLTAKRVPLTALRSDYAIAGGAGSIAGSAQLRQAGSRVDLTVSALDLHGLHAPLRPTRLNGTVRAELTGARQRVQAKLAEKTTTLAFEAVRAGEVVTVQRFVAQAGEGAIEGAGEVLLAGNKRYRVQAALKRFDPSKVGEYPAATLNGDLKLSGILEPAWRADVALLLANSLYRGVRLAGEASGTVTANSAENVKVALTAGANTLRVNGSFGRPRDMLEFALDAKRLSELDPRVAGAMSANGRIAGDTKHPEIKIKVAGSGLGWNRNLRIAAFTGEAHGTGAKHVANIRAKGEDFDFATQLEGAWDPQRGWLGAVASFENVGKYPITLAAPMPLAYGRDRLAAGPAQLRFAGGRISLAALSREHGRLNTQGELANVPLAPFIALTGSTAVRTDLRVNGRWTLNATPRLNGTIALARESGDIVVTADTPVALQLSRLQVDARVVDDAVNGTVDVAAQTLSGRMQMTTTGLARESALKLDGKVDIATLQLLDALIGTHALLKGRAGVVVAANGTLAAPRFTGTAVAENLAVEAPQYGVRLHDGALRAELTDTALVLREFAIRGDEGRLTATGTMSRSAAGETKLAWQAEHLRVANRPDMRLKVDGNGTAALAQKKLVLRGALRAEDGYFEFNRPSAPKLADDIVVIGRPRAQPRSARRPFETQALDVDVSVDAGERVRIVGAGLDTYLRGKVQVQTSRRGVLEARGVLSSERGVYYAFGQRLDIERARLIFDGPIDNPALDILAKRRHLAVEQGVEVTGSVRVPSIRLVSDPPVSDSEKLAWLTLGRGLKDANPTDLGVLQTAASALMSKGDSVPLTQRIANKIGLDEIALRGSGSASGQVAAVGKHISDKLYLEYEQGLAATSTVLRLSYALTRALSVRLETGFSSGIGLFFTRAYD
jgi:translocation and assembly module TamB